MCFSRLLYICYNETIWWSTIDQPGIQDWNIILFDADLHFKQTEIVKFHDPAIPYLTDPILKYLTMDFQRPATQLLWPVLMPFLLDVAAHLTVSWSRDNQGCEPLKWNWGGKQNTKIEMQF